MIAYPGEGGQVRRHERARAQGDRSDWLVAASPRAVRGDRPNVSSARFISRPPLLRFYGFTASQGRAPVQW
jgi:hypothetical protein